MHAAEHDVVGVRAFGGVLGQLEGVTHEIGVLDDLVTLVEVAQNQQFGAETLLGVGDALLQFLVGRKALQNRRSDGRRSTRTAPARLNLERLCDGGIGCDVDAGQLNLPLSLFTASPSVRAIGNRRSSVGIHSSSRIGNVAEVCTIAWNVFSVVSMT